MITKAGQLITNIGLHSETLPAVQPYKCSLWSIVPAGIPWYGFACVMVLIWLPHTELDSHHFDMTLAKSGDVSHQVCLICLPVHTT